MFKNDGIFHAFPFSRTLLIFENVNPGNPTYFSMLSSAWREPNLVPRASCLLPGATGGTRFPLRSTSRHSQGYRHPSPRGAQHGKISLIWASCLHRTVKAAALAFQFPQGTNSRDRTEIRVCYPFFLNIQLEN